MLLCMDVWQMGEDWMAGRWLAEDAIALAVSPT